MTLPAARGIRLLALEVEARGLGRAGGGWSDAIAKLSELAKKSRCRLGRNAMLAVGAAWRAGRRSRQAEGGGR